MNFIGRFLYNGSLGEALKVGYDYKVLFVSFLISVFTIYVAFETAERLKADEENSSHKNFWLFGGSVGLGTGLWASYFLCLLSVETARPIYYDFKIAIYSSLLYVVAAFIGYSVVKKKIFSWASYIIGGFFLSSLFVLSNFASNESIASSLNVIYSPFSAASGAFFTFAGMYVGLFIAVKGNIGFLTKQLIRRVLCSLLIGSSLFCSNYFQIHSLIFFESDSAAFKTDNTNFLALSVSLVTLSVLGIGLIVSVYRQVLNSALSKKNAKLKSQERQLKKLNSSLEERVKSRTEELHKLYKALEEKNSQLTKALDKANEASKAKSAFLANMSHELRTPLNAIIGISELLIEEKEETDKDSLEPLGRVLKAGKNLLELITDILDLSKIEAGKTLLEVEKFALVPFLEDLKKVSSPLADKNGNKIDFYYPKDIGETENDPAKLKRILGNLISNACKFTEKGSIKISAAPKEKSGKDFVEFLIEDTGIGIAKEHISKLFGDFVQVDSSNTRKFGGSGMGLALSKKLCDLMGGNISIESELGKGSKLLVSVPRNIKV